MPDTSLRQRGGSKAVAETIASTPEHDKPSAEEEELPAWVGCACCSLLAIVMAALFALGYLMMPGRDAFDATRVVQFKHDAILRTVVWPAPGRAPVSGVNTKDTDWAIFFYKPYCPACKRVWPVFRALANTVNSTKLRFGEVDCVKDRGVCTMLGAEKHPLIRLYKSVPTTSKEGNTWKREGAADWQGLLIAYEIMQWFIDQQGAGLVHADVQWPSPERLALEMRNLKSSGRTSHESTMQKRPEDPGGYIHDAELALQYGLIDHVMAAPRAGAMEPELSGERLLDLLRWVSLQQELFPRAAVRKKLEALFKRLQQRQQWTDSAYVKTLRALGFKTSPVDDADWRWCTPSSSNTDAHTVGGYTCGLWLLFHTTLANSDRVSAPDVLKMIRSWVGTFFGCSHCAAHFVNYYNQNGGGRVRDHIGAVLWLWKAHNAVSMRLRLEEAAAGDENRGGRPRTIWPSLEMCKICYKEEVRGNESVPSTVSSTKDVDEQWDVHNVFEYHQETFCFESDTFVCSGFDDPSRDQDQRKKFQEDAARDTIAKTDDSKPKKSAV
ncbi:hypothetical protein AB1Y20_017729 [Prymnesium parvum]|uniref:Sulfhydryl oxidase n=1 Tax=Prymnesium parvum TaxID=97485 RepID=A0AB34JPS8_PRYPA